MTESMGLRQGFTGILIGLSLLLAILMSGRISKSIIRVNEAAKELDKTEGFRRELLANVSHDLRTPLTMIIAYAEVMRDLPGFLAGICIAALMGISGCSNSADTAKSSTDTSTASLEKEEEKNTDKSQKTEEEKETAEKIVIEDLEDITDWKTMAEIQLGDNLKIDVKLILDGALITSKDGPAIYGENAKSIYIETQKGTENTQEEVPCNKKYCAKKPAKGRFFSAMP